ncbi:MAG TPA: hypothetical protein VFL17_02460 [Anaerolineae bacterium]|nr:hypothetical protein [Anaerolineae bacterium]
MLAMTLAGFEGSLRRHMPASAYRDFYLWAISAENPRQDAFLQAMGIPLLTKLTVTLLDNLVDDRAWRQLAECSAPISSYLTYEVVSDNLAIGLASPRPDDMTGVLRRFLVRAFNHAMIARLSGDPRPAAQLLAPLQSTARRISGFDQSLNRDKQRACSEAYLILRSDLELADLEYAVWPALVANVEACLDLAESLRARHAAGLLREGLVRRYQAVNHLLEARNTPLPQLVAVGADAILVAPTLAYYVAVLAEIIQPLERFSHVIADGTLASALYDAALLVRLLNDLGTGLVTLAARERSALLDMMMTQYRECSTARTTADLLLNMSDDMDLFTRLRKDILFGEFNVALDGLAHIRLTPDTLLAFGRNLSYLSQLYAQRRTTLQETLAAIGERLGDERVSALISRFVQFHEQLYSNSFHTPAGEYAI